MQKLVIKYLRLEMSVPMNLNLPGKNGNTYVVDCYIHTVVKHGVNI